jgi:NitT/TauT family transport system substrate-binding protein
MKRLMIASGALICVLGLMVFAIQDQEASRPIRIGINPWPGYEPMFLARDRGLFAAHGLDIQLVEYSSVSDCLQGYQHGDIDGICATLVEVELARQHGRQDAPQIVIIPDTSDGADVILAHQSIKSISGLRGKRIGVEPASLGFFILTRALAINQLTINDVTIIVTGQDKMNKVFSSGQVDATVTYSPYSVDIIKAGGATIFSTAEIPDEVVDVIALNPNLATGEVRAKMLAMWSDVMDIIEGEPEVSYGIMAKRQKITVEEFRQSLKGVQLMNRQDQERLLMPGGQVEKSQLLIREIFTAQQSSKTP